MTAKAAPDTLSNDDLIIENDALIPPDADLALDIPSSLDEPSTTGASSSTPGYRQTSEYMIGHVAVGLILPESDGRHETDSEEWTDTEIEHVQAEVQDALAWWAGLEPAAHLTFTIESHLRVPTGYEPIVHTLGEEGQWIGETMAALGFENDNYFNAVRDYVNDLRERVGSDWAFAIFVADSSADADGRFSDDYFAYAYVGGPFQVMTYDNSNYGIHNMDAVATHETGHIFYALDQYTSSGARCDYRSGYLDVENGNSLAGGDCASDAPSIMRGGITPYHNHSLDHFARGQVGWWDSNGNGVLDPVDAPPQLGANLEEEDGNWLILGGQTWQEPVPPLSPWMADVTISHITAVEALVDHTTRVAATSLDGDFDTLSETFRLEADLLTPGLHTLAIQAVNSEGLASSAWVTITLVLDPVDGALDSLLTSRPAVVAGNEPIQFEGIAAAAYGNGAPDAPTVTMVQFSIDGGEWQDAVAGDGGFDSSIEDFNITLTDLPDGQHSLTVRTIDSGGQVETNVESHQFQVETVFNIYLPMVQR